MRASIRSLNQLESLKNTSRDILRSMNISLQEVVATDLSETEIATIMKLANTGF